MMATTDSDGPYWTPETIAASLAEPGIHLQTPQERERWLEHYRRLDALLAGETDRL